MPIVTCIEGNNSKLVKQVVELYGNDARLIADVTYGKGNFWNWNWCELLHTLLASDIEPSLPNVRKEDFTNLSYPDNYVDMLFLDPPYAYHAPQYHNDAYKNQERYNTGVSEKSVLDLYQKGIDEAVRVVKPSGIICVKCCDQISGGKNRFDHIQIYIWAMWRNLLAEDLFILKTTNNPMMRHDYQLHARKNHSYLWVFRNKKNS
jgi:DNA modification methylase